MRSDGLLVIGPIDWNPEDWDYQTSDAAVERVLGEVKATGEVTGYTSFESEGGALYCFVPDKVESSNPNFIGQLSDYLGRVTEMPGTGSIWIMEKDSTID